MFSEARTTMLCPLTNDLISLSNIESVFAQRGVNAMSWRLQCALDFSKILFVTQTHFSIIYNTRWYAIFTAVKLAN